MYGIFRSRFQPEAVKNTPTVRKIQLTLVAEAYYFNLNEEWR